MGSVQGEEDSTTRWPHNNGCDAWILEANCQLPESYARNRLRRLHLRMQLTDFTDKYLDYFDKRNVEAIRGGLIFLRKRKSNWARLLQSSKSSPKPIEMPFAGIANRDLIHYRIQRLDHELATRDLQRHPTTRAVTLSGTTDYRCNKITKWCGIPQSCNRRTSEIVL